MRGFATGVGVEADIGAPRRAPWRRPGGFFYAGLTTAAALRHIDAGDGEDTGVLFPKDVLGGD